MYTTEMSNMARRVNFFRFVDSSNVLILSNKTVFETVFENDS